MASVISQTSASGILDDYTPSDLPDRFSRSATNVAPAQEPSIPRPLSPMSAKREIFVSPYKTFWMLSTRTFRVRTSNTR